MTAAVQLVKEQTNFLQTDIVELNALRCEIQQLQGCDNDASASLACLRRVQNETFDAQIQKCKGMYKLGGRCRQSFQSSRVQGLVTNSKEPSADDARSCFVLLQ